MNLDYLFQQIIESEQQVHCRLTSINEAKKQNAECLSSLKKLKFEVLAYKGNVDLQTTKLVEVTASNDWTLGRIMILEQLRTALTSKRDKLTHELEAVRAMTSRCQESFLKETEDFDRKYDLSGRNTHNKQVKVLLDIRQLEDDLSDLHQELNTLQQSSMIDNDQCGRNNSINASQNYAIDWQSRCSSEERLIDKLQVEKDRISNVPIDDEEFTRLTAELEDLRNCSSLEAKCIALRHELHQLQQSRWQHRQQHS